jgi:asparagine synthetase B (glutamine-hydrolysing)
VADHSATPTRLSNLLRLLAIYGDVRTGHLNFACKTREEEVSPLFAATLDRKAWAHPDEVVRHYVNRCAPTNTANLLAYVALGLLSSDGTVPSIPAVSDPVDLEVRFPYLDAELLGYIASVPTSLRYRHGVPKPMLRAIASELIPGLVAKRPARAFRMPMVEWLQGPLKPLVETVLAPEALEERGLFDVNTVHGFLQKWWQSGGALAPWHLVWGLTMLELWLRTHVDRPPSSSPISTEQLAGDALARASRRAQGSGSKALDGANSP